MRKFFSESHSSDIPLVSLYSVYSMSFIGMSSFNDYKVSFCVHPSVYVSACCLVSWWNSLEDLSTCLSAVWELIWNTDIKSVLCSGTSANNIPDLMRSTMVRTVSVWFINDFDPFGAASLHSFTFSDKQIAVHLISWSSSSFSPSSSHSLSLLSFLFFSLLSNHIRPFSP